MITRPMLAATATNADLDKLRYPLLASPKLDGIRCLIHPTLGPVSRSFKPIPNEYIRKILSDVAFYCLDGELITVDADGLPKDFNSIQSDVMTQAGQPIFKFVTFDLFLCPDEDYQSRYIAMHDPWKEPFIQPLEHSPMQNGDHVREFIQQCLSQGYEGIVLRDPAGQYKSGRSTLKQQGMIKYKEFADAEGTVIGFEEKFHNTNLDEKDNFGLAKRSSHKAGMQAANTLGALIVQTKWGELRLGTGFDDALREQIWLFQSNYLGKTVTFKYQVHGMQDLPRFPVFMRFREKE